MAGKTIPALTVGFKNATIVLRIVLLHPRKQGWAKIEADLGIIIDDLADAPVSVQNTRGAVWPVAFRRDAFVLIVIRIGGFLALHGLQPRILTRRLVKM